MSMFSCYAWSQKGGEEYQPELPAALIHFLSVYFIFSKEKRRKASFSNSWFVLFISEPFFTTLGQVRMILSHVWDYWRIEKHSTQSWFFFVLTFLFLLFYNPPSLFFISSLYFFYKPPSLCLLSPFTCFITPYTFFIIPLHLFYYPPSLVL